MSFADFFKKRFSQTKVAEDKPTEAEKKREEAVTDVIAKASQEAWGNPENDGTLYETEKGLYRLTQESFFEIARSLERWNAVFYKFWELGRPVFTRTIPTAAVMFDNKGRCVNFVFNPDFWLAIDPYTREFVICHEMLHVILNHGERTKQGNKNPMNAHAINAVLDVVINHSLCDRFDFVREKIDERFGKEGCWIDTVFKENADKIEQDKSFEYYFNMLPKIEMPGGGGGGGQGGGKDDKQQQGGGGKGEQDQDQGEGEDQEGQGGSGEGDEQEQDGQGGGQGDQDQDQQGGGGQGGDIDHMNNPYGRMIDDHGGLAAEEMEDVIEQLDENMTDEEKEEIKELIEKHFEEGEDEGDEGDDESKGKKAGHGTNSLWKFADITKKVKKKKKWESVIKKWTRKRLKVEHRDKEQWARTHRRNVLLGEDLMLPSDMEVEDKFQEKRKLEVWAFQDTSGSCASFMERFFTAMRSIPSGKYDPFNLRLFCFDTKVYEVDIAEGKLRGFGGTYFHILEDKIQKVMKEENIKYPDSVWVMTDGAGNQVEPEMPERWHWFLSEEYDIYVPNKSEKHLLRNFE